MRWSIAGKILHEIVPPAARHVLGRLAIAMSDIRNDQKIKVLVRLDQRLNDQQGIVHRHIVVHRSMGQQQLPLQVFHVVLVGLAIIVRAPIGVLHLKTSPFLCPIVLVIPLIMIAALCNPHLEKFRIVEHRRGRSIATARVPIDPHLVEIDPRILRGQLPHP